MSTTSIAVRNALCDRIHSARRALDKPKPIGDDDVHAVRKYLKCARAGLRLLRGTVGERKFFIENARLRDAARPLSAVRDSKVLLETTSKLIQNESDQARRAPVISKRTVKSIISKLFEAERNVSRWVLDDAKRALQHDIERLFRQSRKAMRQARKAHTDNALHEARKQAKYLALALQMLAAMGHRHAEKSIKPATAISDYLGADRDLSLLQSKLTTLSKPLHFAGSTLTQQMQARRKRMQHKAFRLGKRVHAKKARVFVKRLLIAD
jgi:CHAD domain-containing protein